MKPRTRKLVARLIFRIFFGIMATVASALFAWGIVIAIVDAVDLMTADPMVALIVCGSVAVIIVAYVALTVISNWHEGLSWKGDS